ncbi:hypothetical protein [Rubripirellula tenax]|nr:hypothetical protein [Rubripirellula tenax]
MMSVLFGVAGQDDGTRKEYLERFCEAYTEPLARFLILTKKQSEDDAREIVQDFWLTKVIQPAPEQNLISKYLLVRESKEDSSFRRYLSKSLSFHFINRYRSAAAKQERANVAFEQLEGWEPEDAESDQIEFDAVWSNHLLDQVLKQVRTECLANGHTDKWNVFVELILRPGMQGVAPPSYSELASKLQIDSPKAVGNAWVTVKRMIQRHFVTAIQQYLPSGTSQKSLADVENEAREMLFGLAAKGGLRIEFEESIGMVEASCASASFELAGIPADHLFKTVADLQEAWNGMLSTEVRIIFGEPIQADGNMILNDWILSKSESLESLDRARKIAKRSGKRKSEQLSEHHCFPRETWALIYLLAIATAKLRLGMDLSQMDASKLKTRMQQFRDFVWIDDDSRIILSQFVDIAAT